MPDCRIVRIHKKLIELISVDYSSNFSEIDMSCRVIRGMDDAPPMVPFSCVRFEDAI